MNAIAKLKGSWYSKTAHIANLVMLLGLAEQYAPGIVTRYVPADYAGLAVSALGALFWALRWVTSKPLDEK